MTDSKSTSPPDGENGSAADEKPRLTEEEKKQNHIASEQKRREAIRAGFDRLCDLVPGLEGQGRSEGLVLKETVKYMRHQLALRRKIILEKEMRGEYISEEDRAPLAILEKMEARDQERAARGEQDDDEL